VKRQHYLFALCLFLGVGLPTRSRSDTEEAAAAWNSRGATLLQEGKADAAIQEFQKALRLNPKFSPARLNLAFAYDRAERNEDAMREYRAAIENEPLNFFAHNNLGVLYDNKGLYDEAIAEFQTALQIKPGEPMALKNLETAKKNKAVLQEREAQIQKAEKQAHANPNDPRASYHVARTYAVYGKKDQAQEWLAKALKQGYGDLSQIESDPAFKTMREDRDFQLLLLRKTR
jgi:tetratricopeptide (TPR) repeat protein